MTPARARVVGVRERAREWRVCGVSLCGWVCVRERVEARQCVCVLCVCGVCYSWVLSLCVCGRRLQVLNDLISQGCD